MITVDASILIDALFSRSAERYEKAIGFLRSVEGLPLYAPRILEVELVAVARRLGYRAGRGRLLELTREFNLLGEEEIFSLALYVADQIHPRAVDAYYIATAMLTGSIIVANDRLLVRNSRRAGIEAYYLLKEYDAAIKRVNDLRRLQSL